MTDVSGSRTRFWSNISGRVNTVLPGTKMICALVIAFALVSVFATDGTKQFSINLDGIFSLVPRIWILFSAGFYERSIALVTNDTTFTLFPSTLTKSLYI